MIGGETKFEGRITVFHLKDDLTTDRVKAFLKKMEDLIAQERVFLVVDLASAKEISLMGMVAISAIFNKCRQAGGMLKVASLTPSVRRSFRQTNLINTIEVFDDVMDAVKSFRSHNLLKSKTFAGSFFIKEQNSFVGWDRLPQQGLTQ
jgi:anti-anti-sigma factor